MDFERHGYFVQVGVIVASWVAQSGWEGKKRLACAWFAANSMVSLMPNKTECSMIWVLVAGLAALAGEATPDQAIDSGTPSLEVLAERIKEFMSKPPPPSAGDILYRELAKFRGRSSQYAFDRLGYPDRKMIIEGATVYSWVNETSNLNGGTLRCTVKVIMRRARIVKTDFSGNQGACARYATALDSSYRLR